MTQGVLDLIQAIDSGESIAIEAAFNQEMTTRISDRLDDMRMEVAQNMFNEAAKCKSKMKEESCDDDDEDEKEMKEDFESSVELTEEEFEELQAYMQTEDFEQLDEISKATLASYVDKANQSIKDTKKAAGQAAHQAFKNEKRSPNAQIKHLTARDALNTAAKNREANVAKATEKLAK
jgi:hypothetical protein